VTDRRLEVRGLRVARGGKAIVRGVDLDAAAGEVIGLLGPSGAGKSTFFRAVVGELTPEAGAVRMGPHARAQREYGPEPERMVDVTAWPLWRRARAGVGYVPQTPSVLWDLTVRGNLAAFQRIVHGRAPEDRDVNAAAARVDLGARLDVLAGELSAGERRRLELARAITRPPRVLVCDEPFAGVDPAGAARLGELLRGLAKDQGVAVLLADHHVAEALAVCSRALLLLDGAIAVSAEPEAFREDPLVRGRYLGTWPRTVPPPQT
jgi:lipopolysaccharide export system ATP-binding protein